MASLLALLLKHVCHILGRPTLDTLQEASDLFGLSQVRHSRRLDKATQGSFHPECTTYPWHDPSN
jgi:hypothetical protein